MGVEMVLSNKGSPASNDQGAIGIGGLWTRLRRIKGMSPMIAGEPDFLYDEKWIGVKVKMKE